MMRLASIDPASGGKIGYAIWLGGRLQYAGVTSFASMRAEIPTWIDGLNEIAIEQMHFVLRQTRGVNSLIEVAQVAGEIAGLARGRSAARVTYYKPYEWKGQMPKEVSNERSLKALNDLERLSIVMPKAKKARTDVLDAIGIGLHHLGRSRPS